MPKTPIAILPTLFSPKRCRNHRLRVTNMHTREKPRARPALGRAAHGRDGRPTWRRSLPTLTYTTCSGCARICVEPYVSCQPSARVRPQHHPWGSTGTARSHCPGTQPTRWTRAAIRVAPPHGIWRARALPPPPPPAGTAPARPAQTQPTFIVRQGALCYFRLPLSDGWQNSRWIQIRE